MSRVDDLTFLGRRQAADGALAVAGAAVLNAGLTVVVARGLVWPALAALALVPLAVALVRRPQRGIVALALLVPFDGLLLLAPRLPPLAAGWKEALLIATLAATFVAPRESRGPAQPWPPWAPAVGGLLALSLVSAVFVGHLQALWGLKVAFFYVLVVTVLRRCPLSARERDRVVSGLMVVGVAVAVYGIAQQALGHRRLHAMGYEYNQVIRFSGGFLRSFSTFTQPFGYGYFLMLVVLVGTAYALGQPGRLRSRLFLLALPLLVVALGFSFVRGAWMGLGVGLAYLGFTRFRVLLLGIPLAAVALMFLPTDVSSAALASKSGAQRVEAWHTKLSGVTSHPLGVGVGTSSSAAEKVAGKATEGATHEGARTDVFLPDNGYYKALYELGVLGLWLLVLLLAAAFGTARAAARGAPPDDALWPLAASSMVLAAAAASLVATYLDIFPMDVYFWLLLGVAGSVRPAAPVPL